MLSGAALLYSHSISGSRRRRDRSCGRHSFTAAPHLVLPALGNVLRNRRPAARSHLHSLRRPCRWAFTLLICLLPSIAVALTAVCVLPFLALLAFRRASPEIEADVTAPLTRLALRRAVGDLWPVPASVSGFSWKLIAGIEPAQSSGGAAFIGFAAAALCGGLELFLPEGLRHPAYLPGALPRAHRAVFLLPSRPGQQYTTLLVAFLMFGFEVVNLLPSSPAPCTSTETGCPPRRCMPCASGPSCFHGRGQRLAELLGPALSGTTSPIDERHPALRGAAVGRA